MTIVAVAHSTSILYYKLYSCEPVALKLGRSVLLTPTLHERIFSLLLGQGDNHNEHGLTISDAAYKAQVATAKTTERTMAIEFTIETEVADPTPVD